MTPCCRRREHLSAIIGTVSAINRKPVRLQSEQLSAFVGMRTGLCWVNFNIRTGRRETGSIMGSMQWRGTLFLLL